MKGHCVQNMESSTQTKTHKYRIYYVQMWIWHDGDGIQTHNYRVSMQAGTVWSAKVTVTCKRRL